MKNLSLICVTLFGICFANLSLASESSPESDHSAGFSLGYEVGNIAGNLTNGT